MTITVWKRIILGTGVGIGIYQYAIANETDALNWLSSSQYSNIATPLQVIHEKIVAVDLYKQTVSQSDLDEINSDDLLNEEQSTEALVRYALILKSQNKPTDKVLDKILSYQNIDGGFGHLPDWQSNPLDTAWVLLILKEVHDLNTSKTLEALKYLASQQRDAGNFQVTSLDDYYVTAYVLFAFTSYLKEYPQYNELTLKTVSYLESKQISPGFWSNQAEELFLNALLNEALHPFRTLQDISRAAFKKQIIDKQEVDGSWGKDAYTTSVILRSLKSQEKPPINPIISTVNFSIVDSETKSSLANVQVEATRDNALALTAQTTEKGNISFSNVEAGNYNFKLKKEGFGELTFQVTLRQGESLNLGQIELSRQANITTALIQGRIIDQSTGQAISAAEVILTSGNNILKAITNADGHYQITLSEPSAFNISVNATGYMQASGRGNASIGSTFDFSPKLIPQNAYIGSLTGKVTDSNGVALTDVVIKKNNIIAGQTDSNGNFLLQDIQAGSFNLVFEKLNYKGPSINVNLPTGQSLNIGTVQLAFQDPANTTNSNNEIKTGKVQVTVNSSTGKLIQNPTIIAEKLDNNNQVIQQQSFEAPKESANNTLTAELSSGRWRFTAQHPSYQANSSIITVVADQLQKVDIKLALLPYELTGKIINSQANTVISNATIVVLREDNGQQLYSGKTDALGRFSIKNINTDLLKIQINSALYLNTTRYFDKQYLDGTIANLGEIRLRPLSADTSLPDLKITSTDISNLSTNQQTLYTTGTLRAQIANVGNKDFVKTQVVEVLAFADVNNNRMFDEGDIVLGKTQLTQNLSIQESTEISLKLEGKSLFRDAPIGIWVDSTKQVAEKDKHNNVRLTSDAIEIKPKKGTLDAEVVWTFNGSTDSSPTVAPLEDTNGDGIIGQGDIATIIYRSNYIYKAIDGKTGKLKFQISAGVGEQEVAAIADLDQDGIPEIAIKNGSKLSIYNNKGQLKKEIGSGYLWNSGWSSGAYHPNIADLDKDGSPEIILCDKIFNYDKGLIKDNLPSGQTQAIADINGDGYPEIIGLNGVSDYQGKLLYTFKTKNGSTLNLKFLAIGNVLNTPKPQIVAVYNNEIYLFDVETGREIASYDAPSSQGGSPVIADFDGDGTADIGIARTYNYVALRGDGSVIWSTPIADSSGGTGSTVFDFDGDGKLEAVHFDEQYIRVYDAATGIERIKIINQTPTAHEYPVVVDADADGHADIIFGSRYGNGIRMISSKNKDWASTRNIWNQYSYHVTNINDDLTVPKQELNSWDVHNTYRANLLLNQNATAAADATASYIQIHDASGLNQVEFKVRIGNAGGKKIVKNLPISFYRLSAEQAANNQKPILLNTILTKTDLNGGEYEDVSYSYTGNLADFGELIVVANDTGVSTATKTQEYTESNNTARLSISAGNELFSLNTNLDKMAYQANDVVNITANIANLGSFSSTATIRHRIYDNKNNLITTLPSYQVDLGAALSTNDHHSEISLWSLVGVYSGEYRVQTDLIKKNNTMATANQSIIVQSATSANGSTETRISTNKTQYPVNGLVTLDMQLQNTSSNNLVDSTTVLTEVLDSNNQVLLSKTENYEQLASNSLKQEQYTLQLFNAKTGGYTVRTTTTVGQQKYSRETTFNVLSATQTGIGLTATLSATPNEVYLEDSVLLFLQTQNTGTDTWQNIPLHVRLFKNDDVDPIESLTTTIKELTPNQINQQSLSWKTQGKVGDRITAVLTYVTGLGQEKPLAKTTFKLLEVPVNVILPDYKQVSNQVLVYYSCEAGWHKSVINWNFGKFNYSCFSERGNSIKRYLNEIKLETGLNYKVTNHPSEFKMLMRSGRYNNYWVLGAVEKFQMSVNDELRELSFNGESVLFDRGVLDWTNYELLALTDMGYHGNFKLSHTTMKVHEPVYENNLPDFSPIGNTLAWKLGPRAKVTADYDTNYYDCDIPAKYPAIVTANYGDGKPIAFSFDLLRSLMLDEKSSSKKQQAWKNLLKQSLNYQKIDAAQRLSYAPKESVYLDVEINSKKTTEATVIVQLPKGAEWLGQEAVNNNQVKLTISLTAMQPEYFTLPIVLPAYAAAHAIKVSVYRGREITGSPIKTKEYRFLVRGIAERISLLDNEVRKWNVNIRDRDFAHVTVIKALLSTAKLKNNFGLDEIAIATYAKAGGMMDQLQYINAKPARKELDELIKSLQIQWYEKRK